MPRARVICEAWVNRANGSALRTQMHEHPASQPTAGIGDLAAHGASNIELDWSGASARWPNGTTAAALMCPAHPHSKVHRAGGTTEEDPAASQLETTSGGPPQRSRSMDRCVNPPRLTLAIPSPLVLSRSTHPLVRRAHGDRHDTDRPLPLDWGEPVQPGDYPRPEGVVNSNHDRG